jgi:hypothetical protein
MSKGLEAISDLRFNISYSQDMDYKENNDLCDVVEKELKALEIIVTKKVNLYGDDLYANGVYGLNYYSTYEHYKASCEKLRYKKKNILTEEEFNLLKEVLK